MPGEEHKIRAEAEAMEQGRFQGEVLVHLENVKQAVSDLKSTDEKQWTAIEDNRQRTEQNLERIHRVGVLKVAAQTVGSIVGGVIGSILWFVTFGKVK